MPAQMKRDYQEREMAAVVLRLEEAARGIVPIHIEQGAEWIRRIKELIAEIQEEIDRG